jgi:hypothetical protein
MKSFRKRIQENKRGVERSKEKLKKNRNFYSKIQKEISEFFQRDVRLLFFVTTIGLYC